MMYAIDAEWNPNGEFLCGSMYDGEKTTFFKGNPPAEPQYIDDIAFYFVSPRDINLLKPFVVFREYLDLAVLIKVYTNYSMDKYLTELERKAKFPHLRDAPAPAKLGQKGLKELVRFYLGTEMKYADNVDYKSMYVSEKLRLHNREDSRMCRKLAKFILSIVSPSDLATAKRLQVLNEPWQAIAEQCVHYDLEWEETLVNPENMVARLKAKGIDFFVLGDEKPKKKMHIKRREFQAFLEKHKVPVSKKVSNAPYAKDGLLSHMQWEEFEDIGRVHADEKMREMCSLIHIALRSHTAGTGEARFGSHILHPLEVVCAQSSGRVSHINCPITAGVIFRMGVVPPPGYKTLSLDIKSQEVMLAAEFSGDTALQEHCMQDVYSHLYATLNGTPYVKLAKTDSNRVRMKEVVLPWLYGVGYKSLAKSLKVSEEFAKIILDRLSRAYPKFWEWKQALVHTCMGSTQAETLLHRYPLKIDDRVHELQVINHTIQGTGCDMLRVWVKALVDNNLTPFATLHDGCYVYVPKDFDNQKIVDISQRALNEAIPLSFDTWTVECVEFKGHLVEKGDDYWRLVEALSGQSVSELKAKEALYDR